MANDIFTGGAGNNIFKLGYTSGKDTITDFGSRYFTATLDQSQQTTPTGSPATGSGSVVLNKSQTSAAVHLEASNLSGPAGAGHIHKAPAGADGGIVFELSPPAATSFSLDRAWTDGLDDNVAALLSSGLYFNIHTTLFSAGEIRGQIIPVAGDTGADKIDLRALNIGSFDTLKEVTTDVGGAAKITVFRNGVEASLKLLGVTEASLKASDFIFAGTAIQSINGTGKVDTLFGAGGNDKIKGLGGNDLLFGETGNDTLDGGAGNDKLFGGAGGDKITGGLGRDTMTGGAGADDFIFTAKSESGKTAASRDIITDFKHNLDDIDLSKIDANGSAAGNAAFKFLAAKGAAFTGDGAEVRWLHSGSKTIVEADIDGNKLADFQIELTGRLTLSKGDFIL